MKRRVRFPLMVKMLLWLCVHICFLVGFRNRYVVLVQWFWHYFTYRGGAQLITGSTGLDEYEWGVTSPQPRRVVSQCTAEWHGLRFAGQVEAGPECYTLGDNGIFQ